MSIKSAVFAVMTTVVLIVALGNEWAVEQAYDGGTFAIDTRTSVTGQLRFQVWDLPSELRSSTIVRLLALIVLAGLLGGIVGRARPAAAFIGGWAAFLSASVVSAGLYGVVDGDLYARPGSDIVDSFTSTASYGVSAGMWLGWLVGLAVLLGSFGTGQPKPVPDARPAGGWGGAPPPPPPPTSPGYDPGPGYGQGAPPPAPGAAPAAPVFGTPPDRTQVYGQPPGHQ